MPGPRTLKQAKADYKNRGSRFSTQEQQRINRNIELERRADASKERERRRKHEQRKKEERESKERDARRQMGIGLATQLAGFSHTQKQMKSRMEMFLGVNRGLAKDPRPNSPVGKGEQRVVQDPWDALSDAVDDEVLLEQLATSPNTMTPANPTKVQGPESVVASEKYHPQARLEITHQPVSTVTPQRRSLKRTFSQCLELSPEGSWDDFLDSNTQLTRELENPVVDQDIYTNTTSLFSASKGSKLDRMSLTKASEPFASPPAPGVEVRDFAYPKGALPHAFSGVASCKVSAGTIHLSTQLLASFFDDDTDDDMADILSACPDKSPPPNLKFATTELFKPSSSLSKHETPELNLGLSTQELHDIIHSSICLSPTPVNDSGYGDTDLDDFFSDHSWV